MIWQMTTLSDFTDEEYRIAYRDLSPTRRAHIDALTHEHRRRQSLAGEILAKRLLEKTSSDGVIHRDGNGKPFVDIDGIYLSIAHCDELVVCAVHNVPIGIDIERIRPVNDKLINRVCTEEEAAYVREKDTDKRFCEIWVSKEAYVKMLGHPAEHFNTFSVPSTQRQTVQHGEYIVQIVHA